MVYAIVGALLFFVDQGIKWFCVQNRPDHVLIPGLLQLVYTENRGMSFSLFEGFRWVFVAITAAALVFVVYILKKGYVQAVSGRIALTLVLAGGVGNFVDRIFHGFVVDMFEFLFIRFAIFNFADVLITCGAVVLFYYLLFSEEGKAHVRDRSSS